MIKVVLPTYNRSTKLRRLLKFYAGCQPGFSIVILDGSDEPRHQQANQMSADEHSGFVHRVSAPEDRNIVIRLVNQLERMSDDVVAIGNDEDAFLPEFLETAEQFLHDNPEYAAATGRYITSARPLFFCRRISFWTDRFVGMDVDHDDPAVRVVNFQRLNTGGVPPLFWSVRRRAAFLESMRLGLRLRYASGQEFLDQIATCVSGKILISEAPMLLRDESRVKYKPERNRDEGHHYIGTEDLAEIQRIATELWPADVAAAVRAVSSWYVPNRKGESYESRRKSRMYCSFHRGDELHRDSSVLRGLETMIRFCCKAGHASAEVFAYLYFARFMFLKGRGYSFVRMSRSIPVHE